MSSNRGGGRKQDPVWLHYEQAVVPGKTGCRATCKYCKKEMMGIVARMRTHLSQCSSKDAVTETPACSLRALPTTVSDPGPVSNPTAPPNKKLKCLGDIKTFVKTTTANEKQAIDVQVARFIYATNSSFNLVENEEFLALIEMLRPGYRPPSRKEIGSELLELVYEKIYAVCKEKVEGKTVSMELDGWSNVHNDPLICCSVTTAEGDTFLTSTIDTEDERHTADNLEKIAEEAIKKAEETLGCKVRSFVTDNASAMKKMRSQLGVHNPVITYPCSSHVVDRLAKDVDTSSVKSEVVSIAKYFKNIISQVPGTRKKGVERFLFPLMSTGIVLQTALNHI